MRAFLLSIIILAQSFILSAQRPGQKPVSSPIQRPSIKENTSRITAEVCNNNIDDDGNKLKDCEDYTCYYSSNSVCNCAPIDVIWIGDAHGDLYWVNHKTGVETLVGNMGRTMTDITWSPDGSLYGVDTDQSKIWRIDPVTGQTTFVASIAGYDFSNALTSDGAGNLYLASVPPFPNNTGFHIIKLELATGIVTTIVDLTVTGLFSAGDLAFHNGTLYLACDNNILAGINITTGAVNSNPVLGLPPGAAIFGIVIKADGTVYLSDINRLFKLNITTMQASLYYSFTTASINIWGMASFNDYCLAPECGANVEILVLSNQPYCSFPGVQLKAEGTGINGQASYKWTLPNGSTVTGQNITATQSGTYRIRYAAVPDTCGSQKSIDLQITKTADATLGADSVLCIGTSITLMPRNITGITSYLWQDGSTNTQFQVTQPGLYWLETIGSCGTYRDSIIINECVCNVYIPTAFTPNNDGKNDLLKVIPTCPITGELSIYNRWGQLIFYTKDLQKGWNGTFNNVLQSSGLFVYHVKYSYTFEPGTFYKKGSFLLIR